MSTWFSRHPSVANATVTGVVPALASLGGESATGVGVTTLPLGASWPQAAPMSSPLLQRIVAVMPASRSAR